MEVDSEPHTASERIRTHDFEPSKDNECTDDSSSKTYKHFKNGDSTLEHTDQLNPIDVIINPIVEDLVGGFGDHENGSAPAQTSLHPDKSFGAAPSINWNAGSRANFRISFGRDSIKRNKRIGPPYAGTLQKPNSSKPEALLHL